MRRLIPLAVVAQALCRKPSYVRKIAADQQRPISERRYPEATHERFPLFFKDGNSREWMTTEQALTAHLRRRGKVWEPEMW